MEETAPESPVVFPSVPAPASDSTPSENTTGFSGIRREEPEIDMDALLAEHTPLFGAMLVTIFVAILIVNLIRRQQGLDQAQLKPHVYPSSGNKGEPIQDLTPLPPLPPKRKRALHAVPPEKQHPRQHRFSPAGENRNSEE